MVRIVLTVAPRPRVPIDNKKPSCCWDGPPFCDIQITPKGHARSKVMTHCSGKVTFNTVNTVTFILSVRLPNDTAPARV